MPVNKLVFTRPHIKSLVFNLSLSVVTYFKFI